VGNDSATETFELELAQRCRLDASKPIRPSVAYPASIPVRTPLIACC
jgi:hypothetical protein